jgi:hypothetical protein
MRRIIDAVFDGKVLRPTEPLARESKTAVKITVETEAERTGRPVSFLDVALSLNLDGPEDWSENLHKYLYQRPGP